MLYTRIIVVSASVKAVEELINTIPAQVPKNQEVLPINPKDPNFPKSYYQRIINQDDVLFDIFGLAGDLIKYDFVLEIPIDGSPGIILLVDQDPPESYESSKGILALLHGYDLEAPIVVVDTASNSDAAFMRTQLDLLEKEPLLSCDLKNLNSIKNVILTLVELIPDYAANQNLLRALKQL